MATECEGKGRERENVVAMVTYKQEEWLSMDGAEDEGSGVRGGVRGGVNGWEL